MIQRYPFAAYPDYVEELASVCPVCPVPPGALSIDYLIGEPTFRGRRLGAGMISSFVAAGWPLHPDADDVIVPVATGNVASWRALERAGFRRIATGDLEPDNPIDPRDPRDHVVYAIRRHATMRVPADGSHAAGPSPCPREVAELLDHGCASVGR